VNLFPSGGIPYPLFGLELTDQNSVCGKKVPRGGSHGYVGPAHLLSHFCFLGKNVQGAGKPNGTSQPGKVIWRLVQAMFSKGGGGGGRGGGDPGGIFHGGVLLGGGRGELGSPFREGVFFSGRTPWEKKARGTGRPFRKKWGRVCV